jgi:acyl-coenzyme A synthetase/AMP-(fatty) acid ligase/thioesterase domain-containing protein/acyl carrier protein
MSVPQITETPWWLEPFDSSMSLGRRILRAGDAYARRRAVYLDDGTWLTHGDLHAKAAPVRSAIAQSISERGGAVASFTGTSETLTTALIAAFTSASSVSFLDTATPPARARESLETIGARTLLTDRSTIEYARSVSQAGDRIIVIDEAKETSSDDGDVPIPEEGVLTIFTSGSTGKAKGVLRPYLAMAHTAYNLSWRCESSPDDVMMYVGSPGHVGTLNDVLLCILNGYTAVPVQISNVDLIQISRKIIDLGVNKLAMPPSLMRVLLRHTSSAKRFPSDLLVCSSGEALFRSDVSLFFETLGPDAKLWQSYGSTEAGHMVAGFYRPEHGHGNGALPLNSPARGVEIEILDDDGNPVEAGQCGNIRVRTPALAQGYTDQPSETLSGFGEDADGRFFMTGDRARLIEQGVFLIEGRVDRQVNLHGRRIELGEIESAILRIPGWCEASASLVDDNAGRKVLMAMVCPSDETTAQVDDLRSQLIDQLPTFAIPTCFVTASTLPRTATGKTDLNAVYSTLGNALGQLQGRAGDPPRGPTENWVADAWQIVLPSDARPDRDIPFDQFGGDSLNAIELCLRFGDKFGVELGMDFVTAHRTVASQAEALQHAAADGTKTQRVVKLRENREGPVCILVPGAGGHAWVYLNIASEMSCNCDLYALNLNFTTHDELSPDRLTQSVLDVLSESDQSRPVFIAGYSRGSLIASMLAESCHRIGIRVQGVALIDPSPVIPVPTRKALKERVRTVVRSVRNRPEEIEASRLLDEQINSTREEIARLYKPENTRLPDLPCSVLCTSETHATLKSQRQLFGRELTEIHIECVEDHDHLDLMRKRGAPKVASWLSALFGENNATEH